MKRQILIQILLLLLLCGCAAEEEPEEPALETIACAVVEQTEPQTEPETDPIRLLVETMTLEEKIGQMLLVRCPERDSAEQAAEYHLGGYVLFGRDFEGQTPDTLSEKLMEIQSRAEIPLLIAVDEEGGTVCRVSSFPAFRAEPFASPRALYDRGGMELVLSEESEKAFLLHSLGINVNLAPVCDVSRQQGAFMYRRSLGQNPDITGRFAAEAAQRMDEYHVGSVLKHFPGYGNNADTHTGIAVDDRTLEQLEAEDLIPFQMGMATELPGVLMSHTIITALDQEYPASLSPAVHSYLRDTMEFSGVIITDELAMGAVAERYGSAEAAVLAVKAGNDLLCTTDYIPQYAAILQAVENGSIDEEILDNAVYRILLWKQKLGLI